MPVPRLTAVGGILLLTNPDTPDAVRNAAINSLLAAWASAQKATPQSVSLQGLVTTLGKIGWTLSDNTTQSVPLSPGDVATPLWNALAVSATAAFMDAVATTAQNRPAVLDGWWEQVQANRSPGGSCPTLTIAFFSANSSTPTLHIAAAAPGMERAVYLNTPQQVNTDIASTTLVLNNDVYQSIQGSLEAKVAPYRTLVVD